MKRCLLSFNIFIIMALNASAQNPVVSDISISGALISGKSVEVHYTFTDTITESGSTYQWFSADNSSGNNPVDITSKANGTTLTLSASEAGRYIQVIITPRDNVSEGPPSSSGWIGPISNSPPVISNVIVNGSTVDNTTVNVTYTYQDFENDADNGTTFQWLRASDNTGTGSVSIAGATSGTYTLTPADVQKFIAVQVTPMDASGSIGLSVQSPWSGPVDNLAPTVTNLQVAGSTSDLSQLTASYTYSDFENDLETGSIFQWYSANDANGNGSVPITGATSKNYKLTVGDAGKFISFTITPKDSRGLAGTTRQSEWAGPVTQTAPVASDLSISGSMADSSLVTSVYTYSDTENTVETGSTFQWYRATGSSGSGPGAISGATSKTYRLSPGDVGKYIRFEVTPKNANGIPGDPVQSGWVGPVNDVAPIVSTIIISGILINQSVITASYVYHDMEGDLESGSAFHWYTASDNQGGGLTVISGATDKTYTLTQNEIGKYISFSVTPKDATGKSGSLTLGNWVGPVSNAAPKATTVQISGTFVSGQALTATFIYSDPENDPQGAAIYKWYKSSSSSGSSPTLIQNSESETYLITPTDINHYFRVFVTPVATSGTLQGTEVASTGWSGPVYNAAPEASNVAITGSALVCKTLTGNYDFSDNESDLEGSSSFRWLKAISLTGTKTAINGATGLSYSLKADDANFYIFFEVTPKATTGTIAGLPEISQASALIQNTLPNVLFSPSTVTVCDGDPASISLTFTGTPPFQFTYSDSITSHVISTSSSTYSLNTYSKGLYKGVSLTDYLGCPVTSLPSQTRIKVNPLPDVHITNLLNAYSLKTSKFQLTGSPTGGVFSGDGVVITNGKYYFDPSYAGVTNTPIPVIYKYTSTCSNADTVLVTILDANAFIAGLRPQMKYCNYDAPFLITAATNDPTIIGTFSITGNVGLTDHGNNTATITPGLLTNGTFTITYAYFDKVLLTITNTITIETVNKAQIIGISTSTICANTASVNISGYPATGVFKGNGVVFTNNKYYFDPSLTTAKINNITFTDSTTYGCKTTDNVIITIASVPQVNFIIPDICWSGDSTKFLNQSRPIDSINYWNWNFGDNQATAADNISNKLNPGHKYKTYGDYTITLLARNILNCQNSIQTKVHLGDIPKPDFSWDKECFENATKTFLTNASTGKDIINAYQWTIYDSNNKTTITTATADYTFSKPGDYAIQLRVTSVNGCKDSIDRTIHLRPTFKINDSAYANDFENPKNLWYIEQDDVNNLYWGQPDGSIIKTVYSGVNAYYTKFSAPKTNQQLVISSPCFDFTDVKKPFLEVYVNYNNLTDQEGAVLQYASDADNQWKTIGTPASGLNWYTSSSIAAAPGGQTNGWSGNSGGWLQARTNIDDLINHQNIKFRFVYGANTSAKKDGFAFDHLTIGQRLKTVIFEQFTNFSSSLANQSNGILDTLVKQSDSNAISLQYHTNFPGADSINEYNKMDPGARILYYGSGIVPICYLDGGIQNSYIYNFSPNIPSLNDINSRTLKDVDFDISISTDKKESAIQGSVNVKAMKAIDNRAMILQIAIAEDIKVQSGGDIFTLHNVLKQLLPTAAGTSIRSAWITNQVRPYNFSWTFAHVYDPKKLKVIAFLQDEQTREIYQAATTDLSPVTAIPDPIEGDNLSMKLYPNPASENATVYFSNPLTAEYTLLMTNNQGIAIRSEKLQKGIDAVSIPVNNLPSGLYIIRIIHKSATPQLFKLVVIH